MRLFCPNCGKQLSLEHSIKVDLVSNFTYCDGTITLTKHQIRNSENIRQKLSLEKIDGMFCSSCAKSYKEVENTLCQCDECNNKLVVKDVQKIGETIILCDNCMSKYRHFKDFKIFGLRGPDKKTRKKRYDEVIEEVTASRNFPDEIQEIYNQGMEENNDERPFEEREDETIEDIIRDSELSLTIPPEEQSPPVPRVRNVDANIWRDFSTNPTFSFGEDSSGTSTTAGE